MRNFRVMTAGVCLWTYAATVWTTAGTVATKAPALTAIPARSTAWHQRTAFIPATSVMASLTAQMVQTRTIAQISIQKFAPSQSSHAPMDNVWLVPGGATTPMTV